MVEWNVDVCVKGTLDDEALDRLADSALGGLVATKDGYTRLTFDWSCGCVVCPKSPKTPNAAVKRVRRYLRAAGLVPISDYRVYDQAVDDED